MDILSSQLSQNTAKKSDFEKVLWLVQLMKWVQRPRTGEEKNTKVETVYTVRLKYLLLMLHKNPEWKANFVTTISELLTRISSRSQFSAIGFSSNSFLQELVHRLQEMILPKSPLNDDLTALIFEIFPNEDESLFVDFIDEQILGEVIDLFSAETALHQRLQKDILSASYVLSVQILNSVFLMQQQVNRQENEPENLAEFKLEGLLRQHQLGESIVFEKELFTGLSDIEKNTEQLYLSMQESGVKIELVYLFQAQRRKIRRLRILLSFLNPRVSNALNVRYFISHLIIESYHHKSLKSFISENLSLLTERIVQNNSHHGEHYVTFNWADFRQMMKSAMGGGALTSLTVFIKVGLTQFKLVGFIKGFTESLNYSSSFLLIQIMGWTLATKQPSSTAPFIAAALKKSTTEARRSIVALLRTQLIAVIGNLSMVFPICFVVSFILVKVGYPLLSVEEAGEVLHSTNVLGPAPLFAAFTGLLLFSSSLIAGWSENWFAVNRIRKRIKYNEKLIKLFGAQRTEKIAIFSENNSNALAANISLGFLLGLLPQIIKFFGIPLEVKHVTLATGSFATALPQLLHTAINPWDLVNSVLGLAAIGFLNLTVSFVMAFLLASISSKVKFSSFAKLFRAGFRLILNRPWLLIVPEKEKDNKLIS